MPPLFQLRGLSKTYQMGEVAVRALRDVDLRIEEGEFVAILGASGSGKSTLMHIIGFMDKPTAGTILFEGEDVSALSDQARARLRGEKIGFVFQAFNLLSRLNVLENTLLPLMYQRVPQKEAKRPSAFPTAPIITPTSYPADSDSASPSPVPLLTGPGSCSQTSPPAISTPKTQPLFSISSRNCTGKVTP